MTHPLHAPHYADRACHQRATVLENVRIARDTYRIRLACPELARRIVPGQFLMLRLAGCDDPLLGRPLALYDTVASGDGDDPVGVDVVYLVVGKMTRRLAEVRPGQALETWGPLGNGFPPLAAEHLVMVAGGIGQTPFMALAREYLGRRQYGDPPRRVPPARRVTLCYGARTKDYLAGVDDFAALGVEVRTSTDDGTAGHRGLVTEVADQVLAEGPGVRVVCCGPEPMLAVDYFDWRKGGGSPAAIIKSWRKHQLDAIIAVADFDQVDLRHRGVLPPIRSSEDVYNYGSGQPSRLL